jgi:hypothetical protein
LKGGLALKKPIIKFTFISFLILSISMPSAAVQFKQIGWQDLIKKFEFEDPFEALTPDQLGDLGMVARVRQLQASGRQVSEETINEMEEATLRLEKSGVDIYGLLARRGEIRELRSQRAHAVVKDLNGRQIRIPGYALPLEFSGTLITEFLLVPWVGACIHTPPPPPNQIVYVKLKKGIENAGGFTPVWVTGEMKVKAATKNLYLVDGSAGIDVGYSLEASRVEPYKGK